MSETHAPFWIYGAGRLALRFAPSSLPRHITVDGRRTVVAAKRDWHLVTVDVPRLVETTGGNRRVGLRLKDVTWSATQAR
jgi:hypothetical protein